MSQQQPPTPAEPDNLDEDAAGDRLVLAKNGWVRFDAGELVIRLRPPFFGELTELRSRMENVSDEVNDLAEEVSSVADDIEAEEEKLADSDLDDRAKAKARRAAMRRSSQAARELSRKQEVLWLGWWAYALETLAVNTDAASTKWVTEAQADHAKMPAWAALAGPAMRVLNHWRQGPLARG